MYSIKRYLLFAALVLNSLFLFAQDTIWYNSNWRATKHKEDAAFFRPPIKKVGDKYLLTDYYISGKKQMEGYSLKQDEEDWDGPLVWYFADGDTQRLIEYKNNKANGNFIEYHGNGKIARKSTFKDNLPDGEIRHYYYTGQLKGKQFFKNGKTEGEVVVYYRDGKVKEQGFYNDGVPENYAYKYDPDGNILEETGYRNGERISYRTPQIEEDLEYETEPYYEQHGQTLYPSLKKEWLPPVKFNNTKQGRDTIFKASFVFDGYEVTCNYSSNEDLVYELKEAYKQPVGSQINLYFTKYTGSFTEIRYYGCTMGKKAQARLNTELSESDEIISAIHQLLPAEKLLKYKYGNAFTEAILSPDGASEEIVVAEIIEEDMEAAPTEFTIVNEIPEYPGGDQALLDFLAANLVYPEEEKAKTESTKVLMQFMVTEDGSIDDIFFLRSGGKYFDTEAIRVVEMMPKFKPAMSRDKPVKVKYVLPILFEVPTEKK